MKIGTVLLGTHPVIAVTVTDREPPVLLRRAKQLGAHLFEVRIDRFRCLEGPAVLKRLVALKKVGLPLIATVRSRLEGGGRSLSEAKRLQLFRCVLPYVDAVDIELNAVTLRRNLVPAARRKGKRAILSYHNFKSTPSDSVLLQLVRKAKHEKADLVKLAVTPEKAGDIGRLLLFTRRHRKANLVTIAMGKRGAVSRVLAPLFGSLLAYTYAGAGRPQAPGQLGLAAIGRLIKLARASRSGQLGLRRLSKELKCFSRLTARSFA